MKASDGAIALVVDSHELHRAGLAAILRCNLGFSKVIEAETPSDALAHLVGSPAITLASFDVSFLGTDTMAKLGDVRKAFPNVRTVVVSAYARRDDILQALAAGMHGFIPKTLPVAEIARAFEAVLGGDIYVPPCLADIRLHAADYLPAIGTALPATARSSSLTHRQQDVLDLMRQGKSNKQIARALHLAEGTIKVHVHGLYRTLGVCNRVSAVVAAQLGNAEPGRHLAV